MQCWGLLSLTSSRGQKLMRNVTFKVLLRSNSQYPFFYIFVHSLSEILPNLAKFQSITNIRTHVFWTFISENLRPPLIFLVPVLVEKWSQWRHTLKNTTRVKIIITINAENCTNIRAKFFVIFYENCSTNCYCNFNLRGIFESMTQLTPFFNQDWDKEN